jgi:multidrug resistance efflux pump
MLFLPWQQTVKGEGVLQALDPTQRDYTMLATFDGFIDEIYVQENQFVKKGEKLYAMVDLDAKYENKLKIIQGGSQAQYENALQQIKNFEEKYTNLQEYFKTGVEIYVQKERQTLKKIQTLELKQISLEKNKEIEQSNFQRINALYKDGIESKRDFETAENRYIKAKTEFEKIAVDIEIEKHSLRILENEKSNFSYETNNKLKVLQNSLLSSQNTLQSFQKDVQTNARDTARYETRVVVAQKDGYVVKILQNDKHKLIKKGEKVIHFSPLVSTKMILLKVSDFNMPLVKEGIAVRIMYYGWPALQVSGWPKIKFGTFGGVIHKVENTSHEKGFFYAQVLEDPKEPWPKGENLRIGTQATVWAKLDTVPIWYQLWRLMNALPPQMVTPVLERKK